MSYGKSVAALVLEQVVEKYSDRDKSLVGNIICEFHNGLNVLPKCNKTLYSTFWNLWMEETKRRINTSYIPQDLKEWVLVVVVGLGRRRFRTTMVENLWASKNQIKVYKNANKRHDEEFNLKRMMNENQLV